MPCSQAGSHEPGVTPIEAARLMRDVRVWGMSRAEKKMGKAEWELRYVRVRRRVRRRMRRERMGMGGRGVRERNVSSMCAWKSTERDHVTMLQKELCSELVVCRRRLAKRRSSRGEGQFGWTWVRASERETMACAGRRRKKRRGMCWMGDDGREGKKRKPEMTRNTSTA